MIRCVYVYVSRLACPQSVLCYVIARSTHISGLQVPAFILMNEMSQATVDVSVEMERTLNGGMSRSYNYGLVRSFCFFCKLGLVCVQ